MQRPLLQVNSLMPQDLRVQFWCSSNASAQSASPSHTQSCGMHFRWGGWLFTQVNSAPEHVRLANEIKKHEWDLQEAKQWWWWPSVNLHFWKSKYSRLYFKTCSRDFKFFIHLMPMIHTVWSESPTEAQAVLRFLASGILLLEYTLVRLKSLDPPWARKPEKGDMHKVASEAGEIRNVSSLEWRTSAGD